MEFVLDVQPAKTFSPEMYSQLNRAQDKHNAALKNSNDRFNELPAIHQATRKDLLEHRKLTVKLAERLNFCHNHCCCVSTSSQVSS